MAKKKTRAQANAKAADKSRKGRNKRVQSHTEDTRSQRVERYRKSLGQRDHGR